MQKLSDQDYKNIISRRDPRYDGRFYFGVRTTKIYCRPICPSKPKAENILIFRSQSEAEIAGYRACLRCHPDLAPGSQLLYGTTASVSRALKLIESKNSDDMNVQVLADSLGMTDRHLRRLFDEHLGASPIEILVSKRLHLAKRLITQSQKKMADIAFATGFKSIRQFNEAFKKLYRKTPTDFRKHQNQITDDMLHLTLAVRAPFDWATTLGYLKRHESYGLEKISGETYTRFIPLNESFGSVKVEFDSLKSQLHLTFHNIPLPEIRPTMAKIQNLFDVDHNPHHLPTKARGIRVPPAFDTFEIAISIILSQLISTEQAKNKMKKLIEIYGRKLSQSGTSEVWCFPNPQQLMKAPVEEIGITRTKAFAIRELSRLISEQEINLNRASDLEKTKKQLRAIKGIGPWTVEMIAMRCLGDANAFPENDLIVQRVLQAKFLKTKEWQSQNAYLTHLIWRDYAKNDSALKKTRTGQ